MPKNILDYFFLLRPTLFFTGITIYLLAKFPYSADPMEIIAISLFQGIIYLYNQLYDIETDKLNNKLFFLTKDIISLKSAKRYYYLLLVCFVITLALTNLPFAMIMVIAFLLLNYGYSHPFFNFKGRPYASVLCSFCGGFLGYLSGGYESLFVFDDMSGIFRAIISGLALLTAAMLGMILDLDGDALSKKKTFVVLLGFNRSQLLVKVISIVGLLLSLYFSEVIFFIAFAGTLFLQLFTPKRVDWQLKAPILILTLLTSYYYPSYLFYILGYYIFARLYYHYRFKISYP